MIWMGADNNEDEEVKGSQKPLASSDGGLDVGANPLRDKVAYGDLALGKDVQERLWIVILDVPAFRLSVFDLKKKSQTH